MAGHLFLINRRYVGPRSGRYGKGAGAGKGIGSGSRVGSL